MDTLDKIINIFIKSDTKGLDDIDKAVDKTSKATGEATSEMTKQVDNFTGGSVSSINRFVGSLKTVSLGFKSIGSAIALSGLGLLVITIAALTAAFNSSEEGQNKFAKIMGVIGALTGNLVDLLADLGEKIIWAFENPKKAIGGFVDILKKNVINRLEGLLELLPELGKSIKLLFEGEFSKAGETATNAIAKVSLGVENISGKIKGAAKATKEFIAEQEREAKLAAKVADMRAKADIIDRNLLVERGKLEAKISELKLKSRDEENVSAKERRNAIHEAQKLEDILLNKEKAALVLRRDAIQLENTFSRTNKENLTKEAEAVAAVSNIETKRNTEKRASLRILNSINREIQADEKKAADAKKKQADEEAKNEQKLNEEKLKELNNFKEEVSKIDRETELSKMSKEDAELARVQDKYSSLLEKARLYGEGVKEIEDAIQRESSAIKEKYALAEVDKEIKRNKEDFDRKNATFEEQRLFDEAQLRLKYDAELRYHQDNEAEKARITKEFTDATALMKQKSLEAEKAATDAAANAGVDALAESFGLSKELAVARMIMAAPEAIGNSFKMATATYAPPLSYAMGALGAATTVVPIIKGLGEIKKARFSRSKGSSRGGGAVSSGVSQVSSVGNIAANNAARLGVDPSLTDKATANASAKVAGSASNEIVFSEAKYNDFKNQVAFKEDKSKL